MEQCDPESQSLLRQPHQETSTMDGEESYHLLLQEEGTTFSKSCFNMLNALSGVGILSIPYAISEAGWTGMWLLVLVAIICCYTGLLLQKCMDSNMNIQNYPDIADRAFGYKGKMLAIEFLILEGDNLAKILPNMSFEVAGWRIEGSQGFIIISSLVILPTMWLRSLGLLAYISMGGILPSLIMVASVMSVGIFDGVGFHSKGRAFNPSGISTAISLYTFCYCGHAMLPSICSSMKDRTKFSKVLIISFIVSTLNYGAMGVLGYSMFGEEVKSQITLNLPRGKLSSNIAIYTTLINPLTKYALIVAPILVAIEETQPLIKSNVLLNILVRILLLASAVTLALMLPFFVYLMALIGSSMSCIVSLILPCVCYLKIIGTSRTSKVEMAVIYGIIVMSSLVAISGTYNSIHQIAQHA
ncbi:hypothetical protein AMTRI_Chr04g189820 [Amborella trichopoda]